MVMDASSRCRRYWPFTGSWYAFVLVSGRPTLVRAVEGGSHLAHEAVHLVLDLLVRLEADVEVQDHLVEAGGLDLLERIDDPLRGTQQHRVLGEILGPDLLQPRDHVDEIAVARRRGGGIAGQRRDHAFAVIADLARALRGLLRLAVAEMDEVAAHQAMR